MRTVTESLLQSFHRYEVGHTMLLDYDDLTYDDFGLIWSSFCCDKQRKSGIYIYIMHKDDEGYYHGVRYIIWYHLKDDSSAPDPLTNPVEHYVLSSDQIFHVERLSKLHPPDASTRVGWIEGVFHDQESAIARAYECFDSVWNTIFGRHWVPYRIVGSTPIN